MECMNTQCMTMEKILILCKEHFIIQQIWMVKSKSINKKPIEIALMG